MATFAICTGTWKQESGALICSGAVQSVDVYPMAALTWEQTGILASLTIITVITAWAFKLIYRGVRQK